MSMLSRPVWGATAGVRFEGSDATKSSLILDWETSTVDGVEVLVEEETLWTGTGVDVSGLMRSIFMSAIEKIFSSEFQTEYYYLFNSNSHVTAAFDNLITYHPFD